MPTIDKTSYNKAAHYPVGHGYSTRPNAPTSGVVHSTNNSQANTSFTNEANYLYTSPDVSAHFLVGKDGRIVQFLDPRTYQAWHAGTAQDAFVNAKSIGIELHHSTPDPPYPKAQIDALGWLLKQLAAQFQIAPGLIETHGQIAIAGPYIRKTDPDDWPHADFVVWRNALFVTDPLRARTIPGPPGTPARYCSVGIANFYAELGGLALLGYPKSDARHDAVYNAATLACQRGVIKESAAYGVELALLEEEAIPRGWTR